MNDDLIVFETDIENVDLVDDFIALDTLVNKNGNFTTVIPLDGNQLLQIIVPIVSIVAPLVAQTVQKYFADNRVTIKINGIEISAQGYGNAMKLLNRLLQEKNEDKCNKD